MPTLKELEDVAARRLDLLLIKYEKEAAEILRVALTETRNTLTKIYDKYAVNGVLTKAQMTQYNRLTNLEAEIVKNIKPSLNKVVALTNRLPAEVYQQSFFQHAWAVDGSQGVRLKWGTLNLDAILKNTDNPMDKITISKNLESQIGKVAAKMMRDEAIAGAKIALSNGLPLGKSYAKMARDLKKSINTTAARAIRIIRTEGQTAMNSGQDAAYYRAQENGVEGRYIWDATLDGRTRREHGAMDQKARNEKTGLFAGPGSEVSRYPADMNLSAGNRINCRCRLRFEVEGFSPLIRRTRDEGLIPYQNYEEWDKNRPKKVKAKPKAKVSAKPKPKAPVKAVQKPVKAVPPKPKKIEISKTPTEITPKNMVNQSKPFTARQKQDLRSYKESEFKNLNEYLRTGNPADGFSSSYFEKQASTIDKALSNSVLKANSTVYRGMTIDNIGDLSDDIIGHTLQSGSYMSTTTREGIAKSFASFGPDSAVLKIKVPKGVKAINMDQFDSGIASGERELLFGRDYKMKITKITRGTPGKPARIDAELLDV